MVAIAMTFIFVWGTSVNAFGPYGPGHMHPMPMVPPGAAMIPMSPPPFPPAGPHFPPPPGPFIPPRMIPMRRPGLKPMLSKYDTYTRNNPHQLLKAAHYGRKRLIILRRQHNNRKMHLMNKRRGLTQMNDRIMQHERGFDQQRALQQQRRLQRQRGSQQQSGFQQGGGFQQGRNRNAWRGTQEVRRNGNGRRSSQTNNRIGSGAFAALPDVQSRGMTQQRRPDMIQEPRLKEVVNTKSHNRFPIENQLTNRGSRFRQSRITGKTLDLTGIGSQGMTFSGSKSTAIDNGNTGRSTRRKPLGNKPSKRNGKPSKRNGKPSKRNGNPSKRNGKGVQKNTKETKSANSLSGMKVEFLANSNTANVIKVDTTVSEGRKISVNVISANEPTVSKGKIAPDTVPIQNSALGIEKQKFDSVGSGHTSNLQESNKTPVEQRVPLQEIKSPLSKKKIIGGLTSAIQAELGKLKGLLIDRGLFDSNKTAEAASSPMATNRADLPPFINGGFKDIAGSDQAKLANDQIAARRNVNAQGAGKRAFVTVAQAENPIPSAGSTIGDINPIDNVHNMNNRNSIASLTGDLTGTSEIVSFELGSVNNNGGLNSLDTGGTASIIDLAATGGALPESLADIGQVDVVTVDGSQFANIEKAIKTGEPINPVLLSSIIHDASPKQKQAEKTMGMPTDTQIIIIDANAGATNADILSRLSSLHGLKGHHHQNEEMKVHGVHGIHAHGIAHPENLLGASHMHDAVGTVGDPVGSISVDTTNDILGLFSVEAGKDFPMVPDSVSSIPASIGKMLEKHKKKSLTDHTRGKTSAKTTV